MRGFIIILAILFWAAPVWAVNALVGYYKDHTGADIKVVLGPGGQGRINLASDVFFILDGDNIWAASEIEGAGWTVIDFAERTRETTRAKPGLLQKYTKVTVKDTGYTQTTAGYAGKVFEVKVNGTGEVYTITAVKDPAVARLSKAVMIFFRDMDAEPAQSDVMAIINANFKGGYGILNLDNALVLKKVERAEYDEAYFVLPAELKAQLP